MLEASIAAALGSRPRDFARAGGGCIHDCRRLRLQDGRSVFVKIAAGEMAPLLLAEAEGLACLRPHIRVPDVIAEGEEANGTRWLAMEWLDLQFMEDAAWGDLGRQLAALHRVSGESHGMTQESYVGTGSGIYRWNPRGNFIGLTPQDNTPAANWCEFYIERRLRPQISLAQAKGHEVPEREILAAAERLLADHEPRPTLVHGDLWEGNCSGLTSHEAIVFDPAPYFGDPETDLAMLALFGGPQRDALLAFQEGYGEFPDGCESRSRLYDLYHLLNHLNLFGGAYAAAVKRCVGKMAR